jgi:phenylacetaldehyde dehydrogenase
MLGEPSLFVKDFIKSIEGQVLIGGRWVSTAARETLPVFNPSTGKIFTQIGNADSRDVDSAVSAARRSQEDDAWTGMHAKVRSKLIHRLADLVASHADHFAELEALDNGKSVSIARAVDVQSSIEWFEYFAGWPTKLVGQTIPSDNSRLIYTLRQPVGVVGQIIPWNYPLMMAAWKVAPALAAGCSIVLKPAEETSLSALLLGLLVTEAGFPEGVINVVTGTGEQTGAALVDHPGVDKVAFTGSTATGSEIMRRSAQYVRRLTLELGGNSPNIVLADANFAAIASHLASAAFANHGQNCCAGTRLFVPRATQNAVIDAIVGEAKKVKVGPGLDPTTQMGPLISAVQKSRVAGLISDGVRSGADIAFGGKTPAGQEAGFFIEPTILVGAEDRTKVVREEIFGPVITVLPYDTLDEVVTRANATDYGLAAGIWTRDLQSAHVLARRIKAGTVWINTYNETSPAVPFGGFKRSGFGREHGSAVMEHYSEIKSVWVGLDPVGSS